VKILTVVGARPQFVKAAAVSGLLRRRAGEILLHTGQHYDDAMSDLFFRELGIPEPDIHLNVGSGSHADQTGQMLIGVEQAILRERPDRVLVYGDTNSTLAGALAAAKLNVPLVHVEAGVRSFNRAMPEEVNRVITDRLANVLCCPGACAVANLRAEGITDGVHVTGDVMRDVLDRMSPRLTESRLATYGVTPGRYLLLTIHRAQNTDEPGRLRRLLSAIAASTTEPVIFPVHPRTRQSLAAGHAVSDGTIMCVDPVGYLDMLVLQRYARLVLTDSGGVQKEAYWLGVPCVTLRPETEWTETVDAGWNRLVGDDADLIRRAVRDTIVPSPHPDLYGDGRSAARIVDLITRE
jgi:UDP-N-acetylglucosamine 2-epimerase